MYSIFIYIIIYIYKCQCSCFLGQVLNSINQKITGASRKTQVINGMLGPRSSGHQLCKQKVIKPCVFYFNFSYYYIIWIDIYRKLYQIWLNQHVVKFPAPTWDQCHSPLSSSSSKAQQKEIERDIISRIWVCKVVPLSISLLL